MHLISEQYLSGGLSLSRRYYETVARPLLQEAVPDLALRWAAGLVGEGSECFGFDDTISRDHDFGPDFCLWLTAEDYEHHGNRLKAALANLPQEFNGIPLRTPTPLAHGRVGVLNMEAFYSQFLGMSGMPETWQQWLRIPENYLATATNGEVFEDTPGLFTACRNHLLSFYPEDVRRKKIAARCMQVARSGQYNIGRSMKRGNTVVTLHMISEFIQQATSLLFLLHRRYTPFIKWQHHALAQLPSPGPQAAALFTQLAALPTNATPQQAEELVEKACVLCIDELARQGLSNEQSSFLLDHGPVVQTGIQDDAIRNLPLLMG